MYTIDDSILSILSEETTIHNMTYIVVINAINRRITVDPTLLDYLSI